MASRMTEFLTTCHLLSWAPGGGGAINTLSHVDNMGISHSQYHADGTISATQSTNRCNSLSDGHKMGVSHSRHCADGIVSITSKYVLDQCRKNVGALSNIQSLVDSFMKMASDLLHVAFTAAKRIGEYMNKPERGWVMTLVPDRLNSICMHGRGDQGSWVTA